MKLENMFFEVRYVDAEGEAFEISSKSQINSETDKYAKKYAEKVISGCSSDGELVSVNLNLSVPESIREKLGEHFCDNEECYAVEITASEINLYALSDNGLTYAVSTLKQLIESGNVREMLLFDYPDKKVRGYRVYTPGRESFEAFRNVVDMLVYYKYNAIMLEIGGAMEYKRHPEINKKWVEFCREVNKTPYEAERIQKKTHPEWQKNSIHADNGNGSFITQAEMRELIAYCRERGLRVMPEVPSLSHCDYIVMAHPDIKERAEDTYPDTYCPSNPKSYELVFDILDEVIDVFEPEYVNIGHDECYTLAKCPLCCDKDPVDLYVGDIEKINNYLKAKGVKSIMWAEKFFDNIYLPEPDGSIHGYGGTGDPAWDVPRCIDCVGKVPKDILLFHWYWSLCTGKEEKDIRDLGYKMLFGNFQPVVFSKDYRARSNDIEGAFVSNWGSFEPQYMQRNAQNFNLTSAAYILWNSEYDSDMRNMLVDRVKDELYRRYKQTLGDDIIELVHTTDHSRPYKVFYDGFYIVPEDWEIGKHVVTYTDGTKEELPVIFGYNIRSSAEGMNVDSGSTEAKSTAYVEILGASKPVVIDGKMYYITSYKNPYPEKTIEKIECVAYDGITIEASYDLAVK